MHKKRSSLRLFLAATACTALLGSGCQSPSPGQTTASATPSPSYYRGQSLPSKVDKLSGTPLYTTSEDLAKKAKITDGAPFLLIAPQNPSQALLVIEPGTAAKALASRPSNLSDFAGTTEALEAPELISHVKDSFGLELKTDEAGKVVVLRLTGTGSAASSSVTPSAGTTP